MPPDDEEREEEEQETEPEPTEEESPEDVPDPRDGRIAELEAALSAASAHAETMAQALFTERVAATGLVVNPAEVPYDATLLNDPEALQAAIVSLLETKPYLARLHLQPDAVDQGAREEPAGFSLMGAMKAHL